MSWSSLAARNPGADCPGRALDQRGQAPPKEETMTATPADLDISPDLRAFAEKSVDQAKQAIETLMSSAQRAVSTFEGQAKTARQGA